MSLFSNGNARITKLILFQLAIGVVLTLLRSGEMFFSKTVSLFKSGGLSTDSAPPFPPEKAP